MIAYLRRTLYGSAPAQFRSAYSLQESVRRLHAATARTHLAAITKQAAVGRVSEDHVSIQRSIPFVGNSFKPFFLGRFEEREGTVVLVGRFTMHTMVKVFNTVWFGFCGLWTVLAAVAVAPKWETDLWFPLAGVGMFFVGLALLHLGKWFSRNDEAWLSRVIQGALSGASAA